MTDPARSTHFDPQGNPRMVDVSGKAATVRQATACGEVTMADATAEQIAQGQTKKGDVLAVAQIAAIQATKLTEQLIPLCHSIPLEAVTVDFTWLTTRPGEPDSDSASKPDSRTRRLRCVVTARTTGKTGVEMEALTAASVACLTVYDMLKSVDRRMVIGPIYLQAKSGGKSGDFRREAP